MRAVVDHTEQLRRRHGGGENRPGMGTVDPGSPGETAPHRTPTSILGVTDPDAFGSAAPAPTLVVDAGDFAVRKLAALACHASQFADSALASLSERDAPRFLGVEHYRRAAAGASGRTFLDDFGCRPESSDRPDDQRGGPIASGA